MAEQAELKRGTQQGDEKTKIIENRTKHALIFDISVPWEGEKKPKLTTIEIGVSDDGVFPNGMPYKLPIAAADLVALRKTQGFKEALKEGQVVVYDAEESV